VVLKPLSASMHRLLVQKLGGLLNRRIYYLPFDRSIQIDVNIAGKILQLFQECANTGGVLLAQPEHILSFKLMGLEKLNSTDTREVGHFLLEIQKWLEGNVRDIFDESDELLHVCPCHFSWM
jgi:hypothetical protein